MAEPSSSHSHWPGPFSAMRAEVVNSSARACAVLAGVDVGQVAVVGAFGVQQAVGRLVCD